MGQDDVRRERGQFRRVSANFAGIGCCPAGVDPHVAADAPTQFLQLLQERPDPGLKFRIVRGCGQEDADAPHTLGLLRMRSERPISRRATNDLDELASSHCLPPEAQDKAPYQVNSAMSALGQKQTYALQNGMSALPPKADVCAALANVCVGLIADINVV